MGGLDRGGGSERGGGGDTPPCQQDEHIWRRKIFWNNQSPYWLTLLLVNKGHSAKVNSKQSICGKIPVHHKTVSTHDTTLQSEQLTHTRNMTLRNTQKIGAKGAPTFP